MALARSVGDMNNPAGPFDYFAFGTGYTGQKQPDTLNESYVLLFKKHNV